MNEDVFYIHICLNQNNHLRVIMSHMTHKRDPDFFRKGSLPQLTLLASALVGFFALVGAALIPPVIEPISSMRVESATRIVTEHNRFEIEIVVESLVPVNVFAGELHFSKDLLKVTSIDYNTSIADLWAELPWYSNGEGTLNFAGGSTQKGGFLGAGTLIKVTFETLGEGAGIVSIHDPRILLHDGLGTDSNVSDPIEAIFTIEPSGNLLTQSPIGVSYQVTKEIPTTDLNRDGKQSIADISIFMLGMGKYDWKHDFNVDGAVNLKDLNIILSVE